MGLVRAANSWVHLVSGACRALTPLALQFDDSPLQRNVREPSRK
jgi:hypothetical protein